MQIDEERIKAVEKNLREPVALQFSDQVWKIRANLIVASAIALVVGLANLQISPESTFLGIRFSGLNDILIRTTLGAIVLYLLVHFLWTGWDSFLEWRLRVTGTRSAFQTGSMWSPEHVDHPVDPRQSTLYNWWAMQQSAIGNLGAIASEFKLKLAAWEKDIQAIREGKDDPYSRNLSNVLKGLAQAQVNCDEIARRVKANTDAITDERIPTSLRRFDRWFELFLRSQNLRWFVIELIGPVAFSIAALYFLLR